MNKRYLAPVAAFALAAACISSCTHDPIEPEPKDPVTEDPCPSDTVYFQDDVLPILVSNCAFSGCHDRGTAQNGIILTDYNNIINSGGIEPGDSDDSDVYERITDPDDNERMPKPPNNPLTDDQIQLIKDWIDQGALNNGCLVEVPISGCELDNVTFSGTVNPIVQNKCAGCHSGSSPGGGITLNGYEDVATLAFDGRLNGVINHLNGYKAMPLGGSKLPQCELDQIAVWLQDGFPNN